MGAKKVIVPAINLNLKFQKYFITLEGSVDLLL